MKGAVCTICTEHFECSHTVSALRCGHIFHSDCVSAWFNQSMTCPQCRQKVTRANIIQKLFFSRADGDDSILGEPKTSLELSRLSSKLEETQNRLCAQDREMSKLQAEKLAIDDRINQMMQSHRFIIFLSFTEANYLAVLTGTASNFVYLTFISELTQVRPVYQMRTLGIAVL